MYRLSWIALMLAVAMTLLSAFIRLSDSGIGCAPWPDCFAEQFVMDTQPGVTIARGDTHRGLRVLHRVMASVFGLVVMVMTIVALWYRKHHPALPVICLMLTLILAVVGMNTPDLLHPIVTAINLTGGMLLAALLWQWVLIQRRDSAASPNARSTTDEKAIGWLTVGAIVLVLLTIASGSWVSGNFAAGACEGLFNCGSMDRADAAAAFDVNRELTMAEGRLIIGADQALIGWVHHWLALASALLVSGLVAMILLKHGFEVVAVSLALLLAALILLGIVEGGSPSILSASLHNFLSLILLLMLVYQFNLTTKSGAVHA